MEIIIPDVNWYAVLPILILTFGMLSILILGAFSYSARPVLHWLSLLFISGVIAYWLIYYTQPTTAFSGLYSTDALAYSSGLIILIGAFLFLLSLSSSVDLRKAAEFHAVILTALIGMLIMVQTNHLLTMYLGLEILSIAIYILAGMNRTRAKSLEAGFKYFFLGAFSSAFLLFGISFLYGNTGTLYLDRISAFLLVSGSAQSSPMLFVAYAFIMGGIAFKIALIPFHMWSPDVYEGNPAPVTAFIATLPKIPVFIIFFRIFSISASMLHDRWALVLYVLILVTVISGNILALIQKDIKRLMAYSSIAHAGYLSLIILSAPLTKLDQAAATLIFYLMIYVVMNLIVFILLFQCEISTGKNAQLDHFNGYSKRNFLNAFFLTLAMLSLAGIPLTGGFMAKWQIFALSFQANYIFLTVIALLTVIVSIYYYLNLVVRMYFFSPLPEYELTTSSSRIQNFVLIFCVIILFISGIFPGLFIFFPSSMTVF